MVHRAFVKRQITESKKQAAVFTLCVVLSIVTLVALGGFSESVRESTLRDAQKLYGGDIILRSHYDFSEPLSSAVAALEKDGKVESAGYQELYSVVRSLGGDRSLLANVKVVEKGYPLYGKVELKSGRSFGEALAPGSVVVEQALLDRMGLSPGDRLRVGDATLTIADVVTYEPDRPVNFFSLGPRVFVSAADLASLGLVTRGSRVEHVDLLKVRDTRSVDETAAGLARLAMTGQEHVDTFRTARSGVKKFFDNFLFFLSLIGIFTLLLAGIGIQSSLTAFLKEKEATVAILKALGATSRFVMVQYIIVLSLLGLAGTLIGLALGFALQSFFPLLFKGLLPQNVRPVFSWHIVIQGILLGTFVVALFTALPLYRLRDLKPSAIFRSEPAGVRKSLPYLITVTLVLLFFIGMMLWRLEDFSIGFYFLISALAFILVSGLATQALFFALGKIRLKSLAARQALKGLFRPRNASRSIVITLTASLAVIFSIYLVEQNLDASFVRSYPADAPNLFFLDIQPSQLQDIAKELGPGAEYYPVVRARVVAIDGRPIDREKEREKRGDSFAREFNLTYRNSLLGDETLLQGKSLFRDDWGGDQVSVLDTVTEMHEMTVGQTISFNIQGVPLDARISSVRTRTKHLLQPFFYFVLPPGVLKDAPQTIFAALKVAEDEIAPLQSRLVADFPNVTAVDVTGTVRVFARVLHKLSGITRFFTLFSIIAGILIIISSVLATRFARIQEAVYFKVLGARSRFVVMVFTLENTLLGAMSALLALALSQAGSWIVCRKVLDITYHPFAGVSLLMVVGTLALVVSVGWLSSISILAHKPIAYLREQTEE